MMMRFINEPEVFKRRPIVPMLHAVAATKLEEVVFLKGITRLYRDRP